ncbi:MAG: V-type ATPase subunit [Myxococcales bacterium]|nr:V-type ATPase subunit [Myxococcales bacterium]
MTALAARARGLTARLDDATAPPADLLAVLGRWDEHDELRVITLDEDRRALRAIVRGLAAGIPAERRAVAAGRLRHAAGAPTLAELARRLGDHPLAPALASAAEGPLDLLAIEAALARAYGERVRPADPAARAYARQLIDGQNAGAALALSARGRALSPARMFVPGGERLAEATFVEAARAPLDETRVRLAAAFAGTPLAAAVMSSEPAAVERATRAWMRDTQRRHRRLAPHGLAPALYFALRWSEHAEAWRREAAQRALGGAR